MTLVTSNNHIGAFLRARRAEMTPEQVGLTTHGQRRFPGLRREELALLAGVSVGYYTRIEPGQARSASPSVLIAIARALGLDDQERDYLLTLAGPDAAKVRRYVPEEASEVMLGLMRAMDDVASVLLGRRSDILAWTPLAHALIAPHLGLESVAEPSLRPNWARMIFTDPQVRGAFLDWESKCWDVASFLRVQAGNHPQDARLGSLIGELSLASTVFDEMWTAQRVRDESTHDCRMRHPAAGELDLVHVVLGAVDGSDQLLATFYARPGSPSVAALESISGTLGS